MNALVIGGAGFIGSHLVKLLLEKGHKVIVFDDFSTGSVKRLSGEIKPICFKIDIRKGDDIQLLAKSLSKTYDIDCVFHLAAKASIVPSVKEPLLYHDTNVTGTLNVLELVRIMGVKKIVYAASGSCYGIPAELPTTENCPINPIYPYALTKHVAEQYVMHFSRLYGFQAVSLRLFNVFGPYMNLKGGYGGLFSTILPQKFNSAPVITIGDGDQRRDFVFVEDAVRAFVLAGEINIGDKIFNVGLGQSVSVNEICKLLGIKDSARVRLNKRSGEPFETRADISKAKNLLGWTPAISFKAGLELMIRDREYWQSATVWDLDASIDAQNDWYRYLGSQPLA